MTPEMHVFPDKVKTFAQTIRRLFLKWSVQRPVLSMTFVIMGTVTILPVVTAATLMPLALLLTYTGILLAMVIVALFILSFAIVTSASVFHSYRIFRRSVSVKKKQNCK